VVIKTFYSTKDLNFYYGDAKLQQPLP